MWNTVTAAACYHDRRTRPSPAVDRFVFGRQDAPLPLFVFPADTPTSRRGWRRAKLSDRPQDGRSLNFQMAGVAPSVPAHPGSDRRAAAQAAGSILNTRSGMNAFKFLVSISSITEPKRRRVAHSPPEPPLF